MTSLTMVSHLRRLSLGLGLLSGLVSVNSLAQAPRWQPIGISGGGGTFTPAISPANPNLMMLNCDMGAAYISEDGGRNWRMIHHAQLHSDTACRPAFHPTDPNILYASSGGRLKISRDRGRTFARIGQPSAVACGAGPPHRLRHEPIQPPGRREPDLFSKITKFPCPPNQLAADG